MIDTHAHLDLPQFDKDQQKVIEECRASGMEFIVNIGVDLKTSQTSIKLAEQYDFIYATVGYHPHDSKNMTDSAFAELKLLARHPKVVAIGEIGLDFYRNLSPPEIQKAALLKQLDLADELNLPVVLHIRQAMDECFEILRQRKGQQGVLHAFPGDSKQAREGVAMGYYIAFGGPITYPNSRGPEVAGSIPTSRIVVETDCPYLPPQQFRGKRNQPDYVKYVLEKLVSVFPRYRFEDIRRITSKNAGKLFKLPVDDKPQIVYRIGDGLYINLTSRCTNNCYFCPRNTNFHLAGHNLKLDREPEEREILAEIEKHSNFSEIVFCGIGEPTLRADLMLSLAGKLKAKRTPLRLDTNGQGSLINKIDLAKKMAGFFDSVSISLNAQDQAVYDEICRPNYGPLTYPEILKFARRCKEEGLKVTFSVVTVPHVNIDACQKIAENMGISLRVRGYVPD